MRVELDPATRQKLIKAGWRPGRNVWERLKLPPHLSLFPVAQHVLSEFGNLKFKDESGSATLDPSVGSEIVDELRCYQQLVGHQLYPLGIIDGGDTLFVLIDENGVVYILGGELEPFASCFRQAIKST